ncbi:DJ-1/PfpI family protein [Sulfidibacter corallicola]|uniref:DJ-1/PfpI family protein n=1 Tax=Sulfidibacter corallicola TaxID=2818388 RepID=A0A8A4TLR7_SULCO|nr:DJ-1/PfpI family protein [Sulfidibacter corallicola]QTD50154.1 DJ-1/PfpI family protein [Sulfidibacter corallicola]
MTVRRNTRTWVRIILILGLALSAGASLAGDKYQCPPCGCAKDAILFDMAGNCPDCSMPLVKASVLKEQKQQQKNMAVLIFDGMETLDMTGPWEVFHHQPELNLFTVSHDGKPITSMGLKIAADYSLANCPPSSYLLIPGGGVNAMLRNKTVIEWVKTRAEAAEMVFSVCNGAFILAETGLLDGKSATTFHSLLDDLERDYPKVKVHFDRRWVDNGKYITSAGIASGLDMSFYAVQKLFGKDRAEGTAGHIEYYWNQDPKVTIHARSLLPDMDFPEGTDFEATTDTGDAGHWRIEGILTLPKTHEELRAHLGAQMVKNQWKPTKGKPNQAEHWQFEDRAGQSWQGRIQAEPVGRHRFKVSLEIQPKSR